MTTTTSIIKIAFHADGTECQRAVTTADCPFNHAYFNTDPSGRVNPDAVRMKRKDVLLRQAECPVTGKVLSEDNAIFSADQRCLPVRAFHESVTEADIMRVSMTHQWEAAERVGGRDLSQFSRARGLERTSEAWGGVEK